MKAIIDTCVIIDVLQARKPFCDSAYNVFIAAANEQFTGYITAKSVTDIYYLTHRLTHSDKETRNILLKLFSLFSLADTTGEDCYNAVSSQTSDYEDAVMTETAKRIHADCIITRNPSDYTHSSVRIFTPDEFLIFINS